MSAHLFDLVICVKDDALRSAAGVYVSTGPDSFDALSHHLDLLWSEKDGRHLSRVVVSGIAAPTPDEGGAGGREL